MRSFQSDFWAVFCTYEKFKIQEIRIFVVNTFVIYDIITCNIYHEMRCMYEKKNR